MEKRTKYFGLEYPTQIHLPEDVKYTLAKLLFASPTAGIEEVKLVLENEKLVSAVENLIFALDFEIVSVGQPDEDGLEFMSRKETEKLMKKKIKKWISHFGSPTENEILDLANDKKIHNKEFWLEVYEKMKRVKINTIPEIESYLKQYVKGQDEAVRTIAMMVFEHRLRLSEHIDLPNNAVCMIGSTGTGKTWLASKAGELLNVKPYRINCAELVPSGIVGMSLEKHLTQMYMLYNGNNKKMSRSMIHFDEIDKISYRYHISDAFKATLQLEMLRFFNKGEKLNFNTRSYYLSESTNIETGSMLLVFSGAFNGIEEIITQRLIQENDGKLFLVDTDNMIQYCKTDDLVNYGFIPELAARLNNICPLQPLTTTGIREILSNAQESELSRHMNKCKALNLKVRFSDDAIALMAENIVKKKIGARGIAEVLTPLLSHYYFNADQYKGKEIVIDGNAVRRINFHRNYKTLAKAFEQKTPLNEIMEQFKASADEVLDLYLKWKEIN
ncbi:MAG TPA: AAA family ATPase [Bacteroidales bacterium]|nr:AAA family ATPase [Bacteroidales bacterium]